LAWPLPQIPLNVPFREPFQRSLELDYFLCTPANMDPSCRYIYPQLTLDYNSTLASEWKAYIKQIEIDAAVGDEITVIDDGVVVEMTVGTTMLCSPRHPSRF